MSNALEENNRDKLYICLYDTTNVERDLVEGNNIFLFLREWMREGGYSEQNEDDQKEKYIAKEMRVHILANLVIGGETWLHDLGGLDVSYH